MEDLKIIEKAQAGDREFIEALILKYQPDIRRFASKVCRTDEDAEDATQHTLSIIYLKVGTFKFASKFTSWLFTIVKNECLRLKKTFNSQPLSNDLVDPGKSPDEALQEILLGRSLTNAISQLDPIYRQVVLLRDVEELSGNEVASELGISVEAVKSRLHRARQFIREEMVRSLKV